MDSMDRAVGEKRYEPVPQVTPPPPAPPVQYTQPQSINSPIVSLQPKPAVPEGKSLNLSYCIKRLVSHLLADCRLCPVANIPQPIKAAITA